MSAARLVSPMIVAAAVLLSAHVAAAQDASQIAGCSMFPADNAWNTPIDALPVPVRYDEVQGGAVNHAIRFTAPRTQRAFVWPARHYASNIRDPDVPPMGQRFRLNASVDISGYPADVQVIFQAMKTYGLILAD